MTETRFLQIHTLTTYPATLLNRDDAGFAKRLPFGGVTRTRVSSQCLKYHWRNFDGEDSIHELEQPESKRSRQTFRKLVAQPLIDDGLPTRLVVATVYAIRERVLSDNSPSKSEIQKLIEMEDFEKLKEKLDSSQVTILGEPEVRHIRELTREVVEGVKSDLADLWNDPTTELSDEQLDTAYEAIKNISKGELKKSLKGLGLAAGLDASMFGRMATSDVLARGDAALHVAHSFTTHAQNAESDYFSAVDQLANLEGHLGSGHINSSELTSGLFYGYVVVDVPLLVSNLQAVNRKKWEDVDRSLAADVVDKMIHIIATVSPGAKRGSTAPYATAQMVFVEAGKSQPRTLGNAFQRPVAQKPDVLANSFEQLGKYLQQSDNMYGKRTERKLAGMGEIDAFADASGAGEVSSLKEIATWAADAVRG